MTWQKGLHQSCWPVTALFPFFLSAGHLLLDFVAVLLLAAALSADVIRPCFAYAFFPGCFCLAFHDLAEGPSSPAHSELNSEDKEDGNELGEAGFLPFLETGVDVDGSGTGLFVFLPLLSGLVVLADLEVLGDPLAELLSSDW